MVDEPELVRDLCALASMVISFRADVQIFLGFDQLKGKIPLASSYSNRGNGFPLDG